MPMTKTMISATLQFGAVFVPVKVAKAAAREEQTFRTLHVDCGTPVKQHYFCPECGVETHADDRAKGWEVAKNQFMIVDEDELPKPEKSSLIEISKFVPQEEITATMIERSYFLGPDKSLVEPYELISAVLLGQGVAGLGYATLWKKEFPVAVEAGDGGILMLRYLFCSDELRSGAEMVASLKATVDPEYVELAEMFVAKKRGHIDADDLRPHARERLTSYLEAKAAGKTIVAPDPVPEPKPTINLMDTLKEMINALTKPNLLLRGSEILRPSPARQRTARP